MDFQPRHALAATAALAMLVTALCAGQARAAEAPVIGQVTAAEVAEHEAKVEAQVNPGGLKTAYEIRLVWQQADPPGGPTNGGEPPTGGPQAQTGQIAPGSDDQAVSATFTDLPWGFTYWYVVAAINSAGTTKGESPYPFALHTSGEFPNGSGYPPYESEIPIWYLWLSEEESARTLKEYEAKQAKERQEQELRKAAEAAARREREEGEAKKTGVSLRTSRVTIRHGKSALVKLECFGIAACKGKLTLSATGAAVRKSESTGNSRRKNVHPRAIGTASFLIKGHEIKTIDIALNKAGRTLIGSVRGSVSASLELEERAPVAGSKKTVRVRL